MCACMCMRGLEPADSSFTRDACVCVCMCSVWVFVGGLRELGVWDAGRHSWRLQRPKRSLPLSLCCFSLCCSVSAAQPPPLSSLSLYRSVSAAESLPLSLFYLVYAAAQSMPLSFGRPVMADSVWRQGRCRVARHQQRHSGPASTTLQHLLRSRSGAPRLCRQGCRQQGGSIGLLQACSRFTSGGILSVRPQAAAVQLTVQPLLRAWPCNQHAWFFVQKRGAGGA